MSRRDADLNTVMVVQDFVRDHWKWTDQEKKALGDCKAMGNIVKTRLEDGGCEIEELYAVLHDKDDHKLWDEYQMIYRLHFTSRHIHIVIKFKPGKGKTLDEIAELIGVASNYIEKPRPGRYAYDNMLAYLCHIKYAEKFQYDPHTVVTIAGKDYIEYYRERYEAWCRGRAIRITKKTEKSLEMILGRIADDSQFTKCDIAVDEDLMRTYILHRRKIEAAFEARKEIQDLKRLIENPATAPAVKKIFNKE